MFSGSDLVGVVRLTEQSVGVVPNSEVLQNRQDVVVHVTLWGQNVNKKVCTQRKDIHSTKLCED